MKYAYLQFVLYNVIACLTSLQSDIVLILNGDLAVTDLSITLVIINATLGMLIASKAYLNQNLSYGK